MTRDEISALMRDHNDEALLADGFEDAFLGPARRCGQPTIAAYSYERGVAELVRREGMTREGAIEFMEFNVVGAWLGPHTPIWVQEEDACNTS